MFDEDCCSEPEYERRDIVSDWRNVSKQLRCASFRSVGHDLFLEKQCAHCHGEDGKGGVNLARRVLDPKGVFVSISDGREKNGIRMPAWREVLTDQEIWEATAYVLSICRTNR
jgi:mono/diheme cytochrome c family protein